MTIVVEYENGLFRVVDLLPMYHNMISEIAKQMNISNSDVFYDVKGKNIEVIASSNDDYKIKQAADILKAYISDKKLNSDYARELDDLMNRISSNDSNTSINIFSKDFWQTHTNVEITETLFKILIDMRDDGFQDEGEIKVMLENVKMRREMFNANSILTKFSQQESDSVINNLKNNLISPPHSLSNVDNLLDIPEGLRSNLAFMLHYQPISNYRFKYYKFGDIEYIILSSICTTDFKLFIGSDPYSLYFERGLRDKFDEKSLNEYCDARTDRDMSIVWKKNTSQSEFKYSNEGNDDVLNIINKGMTPDVKMNSWEKEPLVGYLSDNYYVDERVFEYS